MNSLPTGSNPAVAFTEVTKTYGPTIALDQVSFEVAPGEMVALLGANGAGKSTAVDLMLGLRQPTDGAVWVLGQTPRQAAAEGRIGAMLQDGGLPANAKVGEVIDLARRLYARRHTDPRPLVEILETAGLGGLGGRRVQHLSGGQAQRVRLAVALAGRPEVLFLDEPTVGFDVEARRRFWAVVRAAASTGVTVMFTTHYLDEVDTNAGRVVVLAAGRIVADGTPTSIKAALGERVVAATVAEVRPHQLWELPGVIGVEAAGSRVRLRSRDPDATIAALYASQLRPTDLDISGASLEDALICLAEAVNGPGVAEPISY